jgi:hypothetical protein
MRISGTVRMSNKVQKKSGRSPGPKSDARRRSDQLIQVTLKFRMPGGNIRVHTLEDEEAERWSHWAEAVCFSAWNQGMNPDWSSLNWAIHDQV